MTKMEILIGILGAGVGAGLMQIVNTIVTHKIKKEDKEDERISALVEAQKILMIDRVRYLGGCYLHDNEITLTNKEMLIDMYKAYKGLGGNGHLDTVMNEVNKLRVVEDGESHEIQQKNCNCDCRS